MGPSFTVPQTISVLPASTLGTRLASALPFNLGPPSLFCTQRSTRFQSLSGTHSRILHFSEQLPPDNSRHPASLRLWLPRTRTLSSHSPSDSHPTPPECPSPFTHPFKSFTPSRMLPHLSGPLLRFFTKKGRLSATNELLPPFWPSINQCVGRI